MRGGNPLALPILSTLGHHLDPAPCREAAISPAARRPCAKAEPARDEDR